MDIQDRSFVPDSLDTRIPRARAASALTESGYPIKPTTLATMAGRGNGPPYRLFGERAMYRWGDLLDWARSRDREPARRGRKASHEAA
jgi:hypothetical protein